MVAFVHENYNMSSLTLQYVADNVIHLTARYRYDVERIPGQNDQRRTELIY